MTDIPIRLGISTCPNDTFAFHALMNRSIDWRGFDFHIELLDIQELNDRLILGDFDVAKASFPVALGLTSETIVLPTGSALGFGVGPLLLSALPDMVPSGQNQVALCPGKHTTAALLFSLFHNNTASVQHCLFSEIMPKLTRGEADFGVCIHEGRFTWESQGLHLVEDLGTRWESETNVPLPLGGLVASRKLPTETLRRVQSIVRESLEHSLAYPDAALPTMRRYAQEFDDDILMKHVDLYVNEWTVDLGPVGSDALQCLSKKARSIGMVGESSGDIEILSGPFDP